MSSSRSASRRPAPVIALWRTASRITPRRTTPGISTGRSTPIVAARRTIAIELARTIPLSERRLAIAILIAVATTISLECRRSLGLGICSSQSALSFEKTQRSSSDLDSIVSLEQRLEREHFTRRDTLIEHVAQLAADRRLAATRCVD
jgi:hypothetical protein